MLNRNGLLLLTITRSVEAVFLFKKYLKKTLLTYKYNNATRNVLVTTLLTFVTIFNQKQGSDHKGYLQTLVTNRVRQTALLRDINCGGYKLNQVIHGRDEQDKRGLSVDMEGECPTSRCQIGLQKTLDHREHKFEIEMGSLHRILVNVWRFTLNNFSCYLH